MYDLLLTKHLKYHLNKAPEAFFILEDQSKSNEIRKLTFIYFESMDIILIRLIQMLHSTSEWLVIPSAKHNASSYPDR
jgi:hypothetical protein